MQITVIRVLLNTLSFLVVALSQIFNTYQVQTSMVGLNNMDKSKSSTVINTITNYKTIYKYNSHVPTGTINVLVEGVDGITYTDGLGTTIKTLREKVDKVVEIGTGAVGDYIGVVTGYGPDCAGCDGRGYVACSTKDGKWTNLLTDGIYYEDPYYGKLQIIAADQRLFPCGTIMTIDNSNLDEPIMGIVLDTGIDMRRAYEKGYVHIDVAFPSEAEVTVDTNKKTHFVVKRWGW